MSATPDDVLGIITVLFDSWMSVYPDPGQGIMREDVQELFRKRNSATIWLDRLRKNSKRHKDRTFVAKHDGQIVGLVRIIFDRHSNELRALYVHPDFQRMGIGTALVQEARKHFDPCKRTIVWVASYTDASKFYRHIGFRAYGATTFVRTILPSGKKIPEQSMRLRRI